MASSTQTEDGTPTFDTLVKEWIDAYNDPSMDHVIGNTIWETFSEEFANFTEDQFTTLNSVRKNRLKSFLYKKCVYIEDHSKTSKTLGAVLYECAQLKEPHEWTDEDLQRYSKITEVPPGFTENMSRKLRFARSLNRSPVLSPTRAHSPVHVHHPTPVHPPVQAHSPVSVHRPAPLAQLDSTSHEQKHEYILQDTNRPPQNQSNPRGYSKEIASLVKMYSDEQKYGGSHTGSFDYKLTIFYKYCNIADVPPEAYLKALPAMLKGIALSRFLNYTATKANNFTFANVCDHIRGFFEGAEYHRANQEKWHRTTLQGVISEYPTKTISECFQLLVDRLQELQHGLSHEMRSTATLQDKVITSCRSVSACGWGTLGPMTSLGDLINRIQSSIAMYEQQHPNESQTFYTDRRYHSTNSNASTDERNTRTTNNDRTSSKRKCWVCGKDNCRSYHHTRKERDGASRRYKAKFSDRYGEKQFDKAFKQYCLDVEGNSDDAQEDLRNELEAFNMTISNNLDYDSSDEFTTEATYDEQFNSSCGKLSFINAHATADELANRACQHALSACVPEPDTIHEPFSYATGTGSRYTSNQFFGVMIDTGAAQRSTGGRSQFLALQKITGIELNQQSKGVHVVTFGIGSAKSLGSIELPTPIGTVNFTIMDTDTPFLLSLEDLNKRKTYYNNITNMLVGPAGNIPIVQRFGHAWMLWGPITQQYIAHSFDLNPCYLTEPELRQLHRRFGHPSVNRLLRLLTRAGHDPDPATLRYITKYCKFCQTHGKSPGRFKFSLKDDVAFNYCIFVDIMYIDGKPVLHIVDEQTRFQAAKWLKDISAKHTWESLRLIWIDTYLGPPDIIAHDQGTNFVSKEFKQFAINVGTITRGVPVEAHNSIGVVERYHGPLKRIYRVITQEIPGAEPELALQMAIKALNDTAGPDGLVPTLLVFGAFPRMVEADAPSPSVTQRSKALQKAMAELRKLRAERQVKDALRTRNGPDISAIHDLPLNSKVLVWRIGANTWTGPFSLLHVDKETCTIDLHGVPTQFRTTVVKPYLTEHDEPDQPNEPPEQEDEPPPAISANPIAANPAPQLPVKRGRGRPRKYPISANYTITNGTSAFPVFLANEPELQFTASRMAEVQGLIDKGVFMTIKDYDIPKGARIFGSRFVDEVKHQGTDKAFEKSRLVVQAYQDSEKSLVLTQSPTIQRMSQRLLICLAAMKDDATLYLRDISQAYVQSLTNLNRDFYIRSAPELATALGIPKGTVVKVVKPLYGVPEAGNHWFKTYHDHHVKELDMSQSTYDPCLLSSNDPQAFGVVALQTDDTLILANTTFANLEQSKLDKAGFLAKDRETLTDGTPLKFNGCIITHTSSGITITQAAQCKNLALIKDIPRNTTSSRGNTRKSLSTIEQYVAQRARAAYIASTCHPEASFDLSVAAQVNGGVKHGVPDKSDIALLNKRIQWLIDNGSKGLRMVKLDLETLKLLVFTDASFANNKDLSSQIGYVIVLADGKDNANVIHWSSTKCKRVTRSVLASELYAMVAGFDTGFVLKATIEKVFNIKVPMTVCTDSNSLYQCLVRLGTTQEKRLMIDVMCLRQAYEQRLIAEVKWIDGNSNPADAMTKSKPNFALRDLVRTNKLNVKANQWVERTGDLDVHVQR